MKGIILKEINQAVSYEDFETPTPWRNEVLVELKASALNHRDVWITKGMYPGIVTPIILGSDGVGFADGEEVIINPSLNWGGNADFPGKDYQILGLPTHGTFAEYVIVDKSNVLPKPEHLSWEEAAAVPLAGLTAYRAIFTKAELRDGENILISGIGGGVALFALQFALAAGANVFVTSGSAEKIERAIVMGAKGGVNYKEDGWDKTLKSISEGFDVIIDSAGGEGFEKLVKCCNPGARVCIYGGSQGAFKNLTPQAIFWKQISIFGTSMGNDREFRNMLYYLKRHQIKPVIDSVFDLKDAQQALDRMSSGEQFGKIVLKV